MEDWHDTGVSDLDRVLAFLRAADEGASTSVRRFPLGVAFFNADLPHVYDRNFLLVTNDSDAESVIAAAEDLQGGAGLAHRKVLFEDEATGARVARALGGAGWEDRRLAIMAYRGGAARAAAADASEVDRLALRPAAEALIRVEPWGGDEEVVRQLADSDLALARTVRERCFARIVDGQVVSMCRLYSDGAVAQIEDVATLPEHRRRGYAEAVVSKAALAGGAGHELLFLTAVDGGWVKRWYERLGFQQIGVRYEATLAS
jgi:ribosomal protein S18 acetylase RimI-like enzyme